MFAVWPTTRLADTGDWAALHALLMPPYKAVIETVTRAQAEAVGAADARPELSHARSITTV
ncbi:MAG TPA: hypothetical protein VF070_19490 [Streptosporangiaceae bacterium]